MTDEAKAIAEVAKTTGEIVKAAGGFGSYLAKVFGSVPESLIGLGGGDWLAHKRRRHLAILEANTARILEVTAAERLTEPSPSVLIPLLQAAVDEGRAELQELWATLLANAMIDGGRKVRRDYFMLLHQLEPADVLALDIMMRIGVGYTNDSRNAFFGAERKHLDISEVDFEIAANKLDQLGLLQSRRPTVLAKGLRNATTID